MRGEFSGNFSVLWNWKGFNGTTYFSTLIYNTNSLNLEACESQVNLSEVDLEKTVSQIGKAVTQPIKRGALFIFWINNKNNAPLSCTWNISGSDRKKIHMQYAKFSSIMKGITGLQDICWTNNGRMSVSRTHHRPLLAGVAHFYSSHCQGLLSCQSTFSVQEHKSAERLDINFSLMLSNGLREI